MQVLRKILIIGAIVLGSLTVLAGLTTGILYLAGAGEQKVAATTADDPELPFLEIAGYRYHAQTFGNPDNPVVIALHGGPGGDYRSILPLSELSDQYYVVFYDQRGAGLSPRVPAEELTVDQYIEDLDNIIGFLSPDRRVDLIGHSWGAMLASLYIGHHPDKIEKAVLAEPGFLDHEHMEIFNSRTGLKQLKPGISVILALAGSWGESLHIDGPDNQARRDYFIEKFFTTPMKENPLSGYYPEGKMENAAGEFWRFGSLASSTIPKSGITQDGRMTDLAAGVENWKGEALFVSGSENIIIGPEYQREQMRRFPRAKLAVIEGAGHTMIGEKPEETLEVIRAYLND